MFDTRGRNSAVSAVGHEAPDDLVVLEVELTDLGHTLLKKNWH